MSFVIGCWGWACHLCNKGCYQWNSLLGCKRNWEKRLGLSTFLASVVNAAGFCCCLDVPKAEPWRHLPNFFFSDEANISLDIGEQIVFHGIWWSVYATCTTLINDLITVQTFVGVYWRESALLVNSCGRRHFVFRLSILVNWFWWLKIKGLGHCDLTSVLFL